MVRIENTIYCGGGDTDGDIDTDRQVFQYDPKENKWTAPFPLCPTIYFGLTHLEGRLVAVGGQEWNAPAGTPTKHVYTLEGSQRWIHLPPMPTERLFPTVFIFNAHIISCGGMISWKDRRNYTSTNAVEIFSHGQWFSSDTSQWFTAQPLPMPIQLLSPTIIGDTCHLIGGLKSERGRSFSCSISLTASLLPLSPSHTQSPTSIINSWRNIHPCPLVGSAAGELDGQLVAVGGATQERTHASVHVYIPSSDSWLELADSDLPVPLYVSEATQLSTGQLIVVGGQDDRDRNSKYVFIGSPVHSSLV